MLMTLFRPARIRRQLKGLAKKEDGAAAIEFAMLAPIFFAMIFSVLEAAMFFYRTSVVEESLDRASRKIRTLQQISAADPTAPDACTVEKDCFFDEVCKLLVAFGDCDENLAVEVEEFGAWEDLNTPAALARAKCTNDVGYNYEDLRYTSGDQNSIIRVRACYLINTLSPGIGLNLTQADGKRALISTYIFRNEVSDDTGAIS
jgi:hypothetical protein